MKSPNNNQLVLGLVGDAASGKDYVASFFEAKGFTHVSGSEIVREEIRSRGLTPSRQLQTAIANEVRATKGTSFFVEESLRRVNARAQAPARVLLSGIYAVAEGEFIVSELNGHLVRVVASGDAEDDIALRFQRLSGRSDGPRDDLTHGDFLAAYERENSGQHSNETNVGQLMTLARFTILNTDYTPQNELNLQVDAILREVT